MLWVFGTPEIYCITICIRYLLTDSIYMAKLYCFYMAFKGYSTIFMQNDVWKSIKLFAHSSKMAN